MHSRVITNRIGAAILVAAFVCAAGLQGQVARRIRAHESEWREGPLDTQAVDWSLFPKAYGVLGSERLMFPVDVASWPVKLGKERQLFVDGYLVASASSVTRTVHQPVKHPGNPVMVGEAPWEQPKQLMPLQVLRDEQTGKFRMWYTSRIQFTFPGTTTAGRQPTLYAESRDGIHWIRPRLGLLEHRGSRDNNWVLYGRMYGLIHDSQSEDPARRYLATVLHVPPYEPEGLYLYGSPDGVRWTRLRKDAVVAHRHSTATFPLAGFDDTTIVRWDARLRLYVCDAEIRRDGAPFRGRVIATSPDLVHWTRPRMSLFQDAIDDTDAQIYGHVGFAYESMWVGMSRLLRWQRTGWKQVEVELTSSRDGLDWSRTGDVGEDGARRNWSGTGSRPVFLPLGGRDAWDRDFTDPANGGPLLVGDELWFYYRGSRNLEDVGKSDWDFAAGLARLRRDGFVSIDAGQRAGLLTTRPLAFEGRRLHVNAAVAAGGSLRAELVGLDGAPVPGYAAADCAAVTGDATDLRIRWRAGDDLLAARGAREHVRLRFELRDARLFSFWVD
jgi:hypothetical protein